MARKYGLGQIYRRGDIWWVDYLYRGVRYRESTGSTRKQDASRLLKQRITEIHSDTFVSPTEQRLTVNDLLDALQQDYALGAGKALPQFLAHMRPIREALGHFRAMDLNETRIDRYIKVRLDAGRKPSTVNRETQLLGQAFRLAASRRWVNRVPHIRRLPERNVRQGFFDVEEIYTVITHLPHYLQDFVHFAYLSGWRKGEIASLTWDDVDRKARVIRLRPEGSKTGAGRVLALGGALWDLIEQRWPERGCIPWVFHRQSLPIGDIRKAWKTACRKAGVPGKLFHDLRRTAVRDMVRAGVPERIAMAISGHTTRSIFDRYNIVSETDLREAVERTHTYRKTKTSRRKKKGEAQKP
jgi:integrase